MSQERAFIETLLNQRFGFFLAVFSLTVAGAVASRTQLQLQLVLSLGALVTVAFASVLGRSQEKLDLILDSIYSDQLHPASVINKQARPSGSRRRMVGIWIPRTCSLVLVFGALAAWADSLNWDSPALGGRSPLVDSVLGLGGALSGVLLGWCLSQWDRRADEARRIKEAVNRGASLRRSLREELVAALGVFLDKKQIIKSAIEAVRAGRAIPGYHVRFPLSSYRSLMQAPDLNLTVKERAVLHNIFERMRVADELLEEHEAMLEMHILQKRPNPQQNIVSMLEAQTHSLEVAEKLIRDFLNGIVTDVCHADEVALTLMQPFNTNSPG